MAKCKNPECEREFSPNTQGQRYCMDKCRDRANKIKKGGRKSDTERVKTKCEAPLCDNTVCLSKRQIRQHRETYGCIMCKDCKSVGGRRAEKIINDPYTTGLFIGCGGEPEPALVNPFG